MVPVTVLELIQVVLRFRVSSRTNSSFLVVPGPVLKLTMIFGQFWVRFSKIFLTDAFLCSDVDSNTL